jgi:C4-dicarboxylate-specific signal transduction histidine kinase
MLLQTALIAWLLIERRGRLVAQLLSRRRWLEVMHLSRTAEVGAMSASFAHELYQPLAAIRLGADAAENLLQATSPQMGRLKDIIGDIRQAEEHAVQSIRHLHKLLQRKRDIGVQVVDLNEAISDTLLILSPEARRRRVAFSVAGVEQSLPVRGDRVHLQQVILNLVANGMDAMTDTALDARRISIHTSLPDDTKVEVLVSDVGTGIPSDKLNEIFDTFYTTKPEGTGLGLAITRTIIETYGGRIWAENGPEGGAVFRFTLPLAQTPCDGGTPVAAE